MTLTAPAPRQTHASLTRPAQILADDATPRPVLDPSAPLAALVALLPILRRTRTRAEIVAAVAASGLLDVGVDATLGHVNGYGYGDEAPVPDLSAALRVLAEADPEAAAAVSAQRHAIDVLAAGRRTAANDRLLRALRRGSAVAVLPLSAQRAVSGRRGADGSIIVQRTDVAVSAATARGTALLLSVEVGRRVVTTWVGVGSPGVTLIPGRHDGENTVLLDGVVFGPDVVVAEVDGVAAAA